jgi:hypothetical protein
LHFYKRASEGVGSKRPVGPGRKHGAHEKFSEATSYRAEGPDFI